MKPRRKRCGCRNCRDREHDHDQQQRDEQDREFWRIIDANYPAATVADRINQHVR